MRLIAACLLSLVAYAVAQAATGPAGAEQTPPRAETIATVDDLSARLQAFDARLEETRRRLRIPGLVLVIVKDGGVVYLAGKGHRNVEDQLPATPDTLFAIGSTTKAFTALLVIMAVKDGKLALEDSPKKCLPYFSLKDPEADQKITVRDLLTHTSGLHASTDLGWATGKLSKAEVIRLAGRAKPVAKVGTEFHYQNVMYLAAGECVAAVMGKPYDALLKERIFDPLGMKDANLSVAKTLTLPARAVGYMEFGAKRERRPVPMRPLDNIAPAGAINASARDMGQWLRFLLGRGAVGGKRLVSAESFARLWQPYIEVGPLEAYGLGWGLSKWNGKPQVRHDGEVDGFVTRVALLPEENLAFGLFTNIENDEIHGWVTNEVFSLFTSVRGAVTGFTLKQPARTLEHERVAASGVPTIPIDALERQVAQARGAKRLARLKTLVLHGTVDFVHEGLTAMLAVYREAPDRYAEVTTFRAFERDIGLARVVFDGERAADYLDFAPIEELLPAQVDGIRMTAWFNPYQDWKHRFPSVRVVGGSRVGGEEVVVVELARPSGVKLTEYYSRKTFLLKKRDSVVPARADMPPSTTTELYDDYRRVSGVMIPHRIEAETPVGKVVTVIRSAKPNAKIPPGTFALPSPGG